VGNRDRTTLPDQDVPLVRREASQIEGTGSAIRPIVHPDAVPWLLATYEQIRAMSLDARDAFVLSLIDGRWTVEALIDLAALPEDELLAILLRLARLGVIELRNPGGR
jgi:hypothetical protein